MLVLCCTQCLSGSAFMKYKRKQCEVFKLLCSGISLYLKAQPAQVAMVYVVML